MVWAVSPFKNDLTIRSRDPGSLESTSPLGLLSLSCNCGFNQNITSHTCNFISESLGVSENRGPSLSHLSPLVLGQFQSIESFIPSVFMCVRR
ncbi:mCG1050961 [Mus musculus]|nr:mCG1050961 [Mus musculus]